MKKNIVIVALAIVAVLSLIFGFVQQKAANAAREETSSQLQEALKIAEEQEKIAELAMANAVRQEAIAAEQQRFAVAERVRSQQELEKCRKRK